jgi:uncharacterized cofD-like protein
VLGAILEADIIILGPGSLFTSTLPPVLVPATRRALLATEATLVYVCNIMTEAGETDGFTAFDHVKAIYQHLGRYPDHVIINSSPVDEARLQSYREERAETVHFDQLVFNEAEIEVSALPLLGTGPHAQHDSVKLAKWLADFAKRKTSSTSLRKEPLTL